MRRCFLCLGHDLKFIQGLLSSEVQLPPKVYIKVCGQFKVNFITYLLMFHVQKNIFNYV